MPGTRRKESRRAIKINRRVLKVDLLLLSLVEWRSTEWAKKWGSNWRCSALLGCSTVGFGLGNWQAIGLPHLHLAKGGWACSQTPQRPAFSYSGRPQPRPPPDLGPQCFVLSSPHFDGPVNSCAQSSLYIFAYSFHSAVLFDLLVCALIDWLWNCLPRFAEPF